MKINNIYWNQDLNLNPDVYYQHQIDIFNAYMLTKSILLSHDIMIHYEQIISHQRKATEKKKHAVKLRAIIPEIVNHLRLIHSGNLKTTLTISLEMCYIILLKLFP